MRSNTSAVVTAAQTEQIIKQVVNAWVGQNKAISDFFSKYEDGTYLYEVAPGRNRAFYILGHLISASDGLLPVFGLGERIFPQLEALFTSNPDRTFTETPSVAELKEYWGIVNGALAGYFEKMEVSDWLDRHTKVSEEDFAKDPLRNKLNVLIGRTNHIGYHLGQLNLLVKK